MVRMLKPEIKLRIPQQLSKKWTRGGGWGGGILYEKKFISNHGPIF